MSKNNEELKYIDLCCGIGGFHQALNNMGMTCVLASDIDESCRKNYELNYKLKPEGDLTKIDVKNIPDFDVLCAGFPCQPFSKAGDQKGFKDNRGNIFFEICKIIEYHKPKYLILENVRNFASHDKGHTWNVIKTKIDKLNYYTYDNPVILNTLYFGIPQSRERVVILCKRKDLGELEKLPKISKENIKETHLKNILEENADQKYNINEKMKVTQDVWDEFLNICNKNKIDIPKFPIWTDWWDKDINLDIAVYKKYTNWIDKNQKFYVTNQKLLQPWLTVSREKKLWLGAVRKMEWQTGENNLTMNNLLWSARGSGVRIKKCNYSPTLVAMASMIPIYGPEVRFLTTRECARLQSFPDDYIIDEKNAYKQLGNAVNVVMIERAARFLIKGEDLFI